MYRKWIITNCDKSSEMTLLTNKWVWYFVKCSLSVQVTDNEWMIVWLRYWQNEKYEAKESCRNRRKKIESMYWT